MSESLSIDYVIQEIKKRYKISGFKGKSEKQFNEYVSGLIDFIFSKEMNDEGNYKYIIEDVNAFIDGDVFEYIEHMQDKIIFIDSDLLNQKSIQYHGMESFTSEELCKKVISMWDITNFAEDSRNKLKRKVSETAKTIFEESTFKANSSKQGAAPTQFLVYDIERFVFGDMYDYVVGRSDRKYFTINKNSLPSKLKTTPEDRRRIDDLEDNSNEYKNKEIIKSKFISKIEDQFDDLKYKIMIEGIFDSLGLSLNEALLMEDLKNNELSKHHLQGIYSETSKEGHSKERLLNFNNYYSKKTKLDKKNENN